jgi:hypothetical protein
VWPCGQREGSVRRDQYGSDNSEGEVRRGGGMAVPGAHTAFLISSRENGYMDLRYNHGHGFWFS